MKKKMNNKGFSLVELIIVVAIMAVLMVVLAPQLLKYVEKSRLQKDNSAIAEIANAIKVACADEAIINSIPTGGETITLAGSTGVAKTVTFGTSTLLKTELDDVIGATVTTTSNNYKKSGEAIVITVSTDGEVSVVGFIENDGDTPTTSSNPKKF